MPTPTPTPPTAAHDVDITDAEIEQILAEAEARTDNLMMAFATRALGRSIDHLNLAAPERERVREMSVERARAACQRTRDAERA